MTRVVQGHEDVNSMTGQHQGKKTEDKEEEDRTGKTGLFYKQKIEEDIKR